jgi:lipopolysaccharide export system protein LptA
MKRFALLVTLAMVFRLGFPAQVLADAAGQDKPVDVSGNWALTVETSAGTGNPSVEFKQDGETLTGNYSSQVFGEQKVTGTIKGNAITFGFTTSFQGSTVTVTYAGTADTSSMKGKVTLGDLGEGTFTGKKKYRRASLRHGTMKGYRDTSL